MRSLTTLHLATILIIVTCILYANTLLNGLFFDDQQFIYENAAVTTFDLRGLFSHSLIDGDGRLTNYYRPILFLGFGIEYNLFGDSGAIYHLTSLLLHGIAGVLFFYILLKLSKNKAVAFIAALFFIIHPVQTEAIAYASGRGDPLSLVFVLSSILFSLKKGVGQRAAGIVFLVLALLSKETALITPGLIFICQMFGKSLSIKNLKESFIQTLPYSIVTGSYFLLRLTVLNFADTLNFYKNENAYTSSIFVRINEFFNLIPQYVGLVFFPKDLFMERDLTISLAKNITLSSVFSSFGSLIAYVISLKLYKKHPLFLFGLLWTTISFIPSSGIIPINGIFYEHFLYYPSLGIATIISYLIFILFQKLPLLGRGILIALVISSFGLLSLRTITRNSDWKNPITFYSRTSAYVHSARIYNNLAMAYAEKNMTNEAIFTYKKALMVSDSYPQTHYNLANTYLRGGDFANAAYEYKKSLTIDPYFYLSYVRLFEIYKSQNDTTSLKTLEGQLVKLGKTNSQFTTLLQKLQTQN